MLTKKSLLKYVRREPFQAFDIVMSDGARYSVRHPEMLWVSADYAVYFYGPAIGGDIEDYDTLPLFLIEDVEFNRKKAKT